MKGTLVVRTSNRVDELIWMVPGSSGGRISIHKQFDLVLQDSILGAAKSSGQLVRSKTMSTMASSGPVPGCSFFTWLLSTQAAMKLFNLLLSDERV